MRAWLVTAGAAVAAYGGWLLWPSLGTTAAWLIGGPILHDAVVAPLVGVTGLLLARALPAARVWRWCVAAGLATTATLLLIAVPLVWRPHPGPANPGLQDRDYARDLAVWLAAWWAGLLITAFALRVHRRRAERSWSA